MFAKAREDRTHKIDANELPVFKIRESNNLSSQPMNLKESDSRGKNRDNPNAKVNPPGAYRQ